MRFVCLVYGHSSIFETMSEADQKALTRDSLAYDVELEKAGHMVVAEALQSLATASTVRVRDSEMEVIDGPFIESKEHLLGFILVEARDRAEAVRIAAGIPLARHGAIEVRPVMDMQQQL